MPVELAVPAVRPRQYPQRPGNLVQPLIDGMAAFSRISEAIEHATVSVWATVAFVSPAFTWPKSSESFLELLERVASRGVDVRLVCWRHNPETRRFESEMFAGSASQRASLAARASQLRIRWDRAPGAHCHHQKSWIIDAGHDGETTFVGGMNLNPATVVDPGHDRPGHHDVYLEISGPSATDVHHNFVQRWNEASDRNTPDGSWGCSADDSLLYPTVASPMRGASIVQIQRTVHPDGFRSGPHGPSGEQTILRQYLSAVSAARESIYIENQTIFSLPVLRALAEAVRRGVDVVLVVPRTAETIVRSAHARGDDPEFFALLGSLATHANFTLAALHPRTHEGHSHDVYVHSKLMLVDDAWATVGSCNLRSFSLTGNTELNASIWDSTVVRRLRVDLLTEHLGFDVSALSDRAALRSLRRVATSRAASGTDASAGAALVMAIDPTTYGR